MSVTGETNWELLLSELSPASRKRFATLLRRSYARQLGLVYRNRAAVVPDCVRSEAVGTWRRRYMPQASKSAQRHRGYAQLRTEPSYQQIEKTLLKRYWKRHLPSSSPTEEDIASMPLPELCEAYRSLKPQLGGSALDGFLHECLRKACANVCKGGTVEQTVLDALTEVAASSDLAPCARLLVSDPTRPGRHVRQEFSLEHATTEDEVATLVRDARLVAGLAEQVFGSRDVIQVCADLIVASAIECPEVAALTNLYARLFEDGADMVSRATVHEAYARASVLGTHLMGNDVAAGLARVIIANPHYASQYQRAIELKLRVRENVPDTPMEAYPLARTMQRHFVVHVGPTNSGKTHEALQSLMRAESGAYLGPLRLLAYEQFDRMNKEGVPCTLLTGEEQIEVAGARHVASTVEMANYDRAIDVAVIDEAQMIADEERGHSWTGAILGIPARIVHICCAPHAEEVVCRLAELCGDTCEVVRHERLVPLRPDRASCNIPAGVRPGDALIVFSRRSVHRVAADVAAAGLRPSLVYGALPHDVRHEEARRFDEGETDVVVATDAIGMGMNLPIRRIVFVEQDKYDGRAMRPLLPAEIQQIAGRAGRFGRYAEGLYQSTRRRREIVDKYGQEVERVETIPVGIPRNIALVRDATLGESIRQWAAIEQPAPFHRVDVSRELALLAEAEAWVDRDQHTNLDVKLAELTLITMPFDERDRVLKAAWRQMAQAVLEGRKAKLFIPGEPREDSDLASLEADYHYCDLLYNYERAFGEKERRDQLIERREQISRAIMAMLAEGGVHR